MKFERITLGDARERLRHMEGVSKWDTTDGLASIAEVVGNGAAFIAFQRDQAVMIFAIEKQQLAGGLELMVRVAWQLVPKGDLTETVLPAIEEKFGYDCVSVRIETRRPGLIKKLEVQGYREASRIMRKKL